MHQAKCIKCLTTSDPKTVRSAGLCFGTFHSNKIDTYQTGIFKSLYLAITAMLILHYTEWTFLRKRLHLPWIRFWLHESDFDVQFDETKAHFFTTLFNWMGHVKELLNNVCLLKTPESTQNTKRAFRPNRIQSVNRNRKKGICFLESFADNVDQHMSSSFTYQIKRLTN